MTKMWEEILEQPEILNNCLKNNDTINKLVEKISESNIRFVVISARGTSDHAAIYAKYLIEYKLDLPVCLTAPSIITSYGSSIDYKDCLVIAISQSGQAADALAVIRQGNKCDTITVGITNNEDSPIAKESDFHIYTNAGVEKSVAATKTFSSQLMSIAHLVSVWKNDTEMMEEILSIPDSIKDIFLLEDQISYLARDLSKLENCFVLARGLNYPIALEAALKIQETCYVEAESFAISDFYHGPLAMVDNKTTAFLFAPTGPTFEDSKKLFEKLTGLDAKIILITNDKELSKKCKNSFMIPETKNDIISPFYNAVFAQMFACKLSLAKGLDPDKPRSLRKVTITK